MTANSSNLEGLAAKTSTSRTVSRCIAAALFVAAGVNHFVHPAFYTRIVPPQFPSPYWLVVVSGAFEILGGVGLLLPRLRSLAAWGLIALLIAVFPANIHMAVAPARFADLHLPYWTVIARLPLQFLLIGWIFRVRR